MITTEDVKRLGIHNLAKLNEELKKKIEVLESELQHAREKLEQEIQYKLQERKKNGGEVQHVKNS